MKWRRPSLRSNTAVGSIGWGQTVAVLVLITASYDRRNCGLGGDTYPHSQGTDRKPMFQTEQQQQQQLAREIPRTRHAASGLPDPHRYQRRLIPEVVATDDTSGDHDGIDELESDGLDYVRGASKSVMLERSRKVLREMTLLRKEASASESRSQDLVMWDPTRRRFAQFENSEKDTVGQGNNGQRSPSIDCRSKWRGRTNDEQREEISNEDEGGGGRGKYLATNRRRRMRVPSSTSPRRQRDAARRRHSINRAEGKDAIGGEYGNHIDSFFPPSGYRNRRIMAARNGGGEGIRGQASATTSNRRSCNRQPDRRLFRGYNGAGQLAILPSSRGENASSPLFALPPHARFDIYVPSPVLKDMPVDAIERQVTDGARFEQ
eukprot:jgi/Bigna1/80281/fgenesh1_pg.69_\